MQLFRRPEAQVSLLVRTVLAVSSVKVRKVCTEQACDHSGWRLSIAADLLQITQSSFQVKGKCNILAAGSLGLPLRIPRLAASVKSL